MLVLPIVQFAAKSTQKTAMYFSSEMDRKWRPSNKSRNVIGQTLFIHGSGCSQACDRQVYSRRAPMREVRRRRCERFFPFASGGGACVRASANECVFFRVRLRTGTLPSCFFVRYLTIPESYSDDILDTRYLRCNSGTYHNLKPSTLIIFAKKN